jgi:alpha-N-arabinofuranosidase
MMHLFINTARKYGQISRYIYGHFSEHLGYGIYQGIYVGEDSSIPNVRGIRTDVVSALRNIQVPVLRWPGGCFAEYYNWRDGVGPKEQRSCIVNSTWGGVVEDNSFGTHEFLDLCQQIGCEPYIACNVGTGSPREANEWMEYITSAGKSPMADLRHKNGRSEPWKLTYLGIGNENWAFMRAEHYADAYRQFASFIRSHGGCKLFKIACGASGNDYAWTETLMRMAGDQMDGLSLHYYTMPKYYATEEYPWEVKGPALDIDAGNYYRTLRRALYMDELIKRHKCVMDRFDPIRRVAIVVDEWGTWHQPEEGTNPSFLFQQNTMRDAIAAAVTLNIFNSHCDRVRMANLAQMVNVLQSVILTSGHQIVLTPTYHVFDLYKGHQDATLIESYVQQNLTGTEEAQVPAMHVSASENQAGEVHVTLTNLSADKPQKMRCSLSGGDFTSAAVRYISGDLNSHNEFGKKAQVSIRTVPEIAVSDGGFVLDVPACCVMEIVLK